MLDISRVRILGSMVALPGLYKVFKIRIVQCVFDYADQFVSIFKFSNKILVES